MSQKAQPLHFTSAEALSFTVNAAHKKNIRVSLALNEHLYSKRSAEIALDIFKTALDLGVDAVIVTDLDLFLKLRSSFPDFPIHISGEAGVNNIHAVKQFGKWRATRIILPRHLTLSEIKALCEAAQDYSMEMEAFVLSERCTFEGANCFPSHGYLKKHLCNDLSSPIHLLSNGTESDKEMISALNEHVDHYDTWKSHNSVGPSWLGGECALCYCKQLTEYGIDFLKIVGRGVTPEHLLKRVDVLHRAISYVGPGHKGYCQELIGSPELCGQGFRCYYRD